MRRGAAVRSGRPRRHAQGLVRSLFHVSRGCALRARPQPGTHLAAAALCFRGEAASLPLRSACRPLRATATPYEPSGVTCRRLYRSPAVQSSSLNPLAVVAGGRAAGGERAAAAERPRWSVRAAALLERPRAEAPSARRFHGRPHARVRRAPCAAWPHADTEGRPRPRDAAAGDGDVAGGGGEGVEGGGC